jgi:hypothetical protein
MRFFICALALTWAFAFATPSVTVAFEPAAGELAAKADSLYARLDAQHRALTDLLTTLKAEVPTLTHAAADLTGLTLDLARRAATACILAPVEKAEVGDMVGATLATLEIKSCLKLLPVTMLQQLSDLPPADLPKLQRVLSAAARVRIGLALLTPQIEALGEQTALAALDLAKLHAKAALDHEIAQRNPLTSDAYKARAAASYAATRQALSVCDEKLTLIAADLARFPVDALTLSADALKHP